MQMTHFVKRSMNGLSLIAGLMLCLFHIIIANPLLSRDTHKVLLLNSSASVEKYRIVQEEFKNSLAFPTEVVNLDGIEGDNRYIKELRSVNPSLVYCIGSKAYSLASSVFSDKPIVFSSILNCRRLSMSAKTYGIANELNSRMQLFMFRSIFPNIKKIGVLFSKQYSSEWLESVRKEANELEIEIISGEVTENQSSVAILTHLIPKINALWLIADPLVISDKNQLYRVFEACDKHKVPIFSYHEAFAELGAVLIVSVDDPTIGRQAAGMVSDLLSGNSPDEKIQFPAGSSITLNLKKVEAYNLEYNQNARGTINSILK